MTVRIRPAGPADRSAVCAMLYRNMKGRVPRERWHRIVDSRWAPWTDEFGVIAEDGDHLAGFLGVVYAQRPGGQRTGNLTSWYIERTYRGRGLGRDMLRTALSDPGVTYTTFSSNPPALRLMRKAGLELLDNRRLIWEPGGQLSGTNVKIMSDSAIIEPNLRPHMARIVADHAELNLRPHLIRPRRDESCVVLLHVKEKGADIAYHEVLHVSDPHIFGRHVATFAAAILPPTQALLSVDSRFLPGHVKPDRSETIEVPRYYKSAGLRSAEVDFLYSEIVLLDLKLY